MTEKERIDADKAGAIRAPVKRVGPDSFIDDLQEISKGSNPKYQKC